MQMCVCRRFSLAGTRCSCLVPILRHFAYHIESLYAISICENRISYQHRHPLYANCILNKYYIGPFFYYYFIFFFFCLVSSFFLISLFTEYIHFRSEYFGKCSAQSFTRRRRRVYGLQMIFSHAGRVEWNAANEFASVGIWYECTYVHLYVFYRRTSCEVLSLHHTFGRFTVQKPVRFT